MKILIIDNYDSFIYNLSYEFELAGHQVSICRNDVDYLKLQQLIPLNDAIILSPGPGAPGSAGHCLQLIRDYYQTKPILGICLGHQAIVEAFDGGVSHAKSVMHGKTSQVFTDSSPLFLELDEQQMVARYHSLAASSVPKNLSVIAKTSDGEAMAVEHKKYPVFGIQFHPESIMSKYGQRIIGNFIKIVQTGDSGDGGQDVAAA